ncbi:MAG: Smr/MutS family protein [Alphaproteobacteria bacterium]|nr:Smr/MutS family protein [Alphaproteobacteria bacterium]
MIRRRRPATDEERALFEYVLRGGDPSEPAKPEKAKIEAEIALTKPHRPPRRPTGIDGRTAERLRKGLIEPGASLDLHGFTETAAHAALTVFLRDAARRGVRLALVVTGKGSKSVSEEPFSLGLEGRARGILRTMVPRWLSEPELVRLVADVRTAHRRHGGAGAYYLYLRKERQT